MTKGFLIFFALCMKKKNFISVFDSEIEKMQRRCMGEHYKHTCLGDNR